MPAPILQSYKIEARLAIREEAGADGFSWEALRKIAGARDWPEGGPRILVVSAHPDDEVIGASALVMHSERIRIVHVTDGAPRSSADAMAAGFSNRNEYADARRREAIRSLKKAGLPEDAITRLGFIDQETAFCLEALAVDIAKLLEDETPDIVLTHAYEGGHPDHDAVAFACRAGLTLFRRQRTTGAKIVEFTGYHAENSEMRIGAFLNGRAIPEYRYDLAVEEKELKAEMLRAYRSQSHTLAPFFRPCWENFRKAPAYDFMRPPHGGKLFYECFDWGVSGETWRRLCAGALGQLGLRRNGL